MASDAAKAFAEAQEHLETAKALLKKTDGLSLEPADMAALAQAHVFVGVGIMLTNAFEEDFLDE